ncbi:hypothetical protein BH09BAC5_BH09BAC5_03240 [soil metagenome]
MTIQEIKLRFGIIGNSTLAFVMVTILCGFISEKEPETNHGLFNVKSMSLADSSYSFDKLNFKLNSESGLTVQPGFPRVSPDDKNVTEYRYAEGKIGNENYFTEIFLNDYREKLTFYSEKEKNAFFRKYMHESYNHHTPSPDTTGSFRNMACVEGHGNYSGGFLRGSKKIVYRYIIFFYKDIIFEIMVTDIKKKLNNSYVDFFQRFELI